MREWSPHTLTPQPGLGSRLGEPVPHEATRGGQDALLTEPGFSVSSSAQPGCQTHLPTAQPLGALVPESNQTPGGSPHLPAPRAPAKHHGPFLNHNQQVAGKPL